MIQMIGLERLVAGMKMNNIIDDTDIKFNDVEDDSVVLKQISKELISLSNKPEIKLMMHERGYNVKWEITVVEKYPIVLGG